jgi:CBS domain-containing protein
MKTGEVCKRNVITTVPRASLADVAKLMRQSHVGSVVVIDPPGSRIPAGIVTDRDIVVEAVAADLDPRTLTAGEIMSRNLVTAAEGDDASWSLKVMRDRGIRRLPVIDAAGELTGIVALDDLLESASFALSDVVQAIGTERVVEAQRRGTPA